MKPSRARHARRAGNARPASAAKGIGPHGKVEETLLS
jgi:hypothetical protein